VRSGASVCVVGRLWTTNLGRYYSIQDCIVLNTRGMRRSLASFLKKYSIAPKTYMDLPTPYLEIGKIDTASRQV
jgi:hypothetical protein